MGENKVKQFAEIFNLEIGEEFIIDGDDSLKPYTFQFVAGTCLEAKTDDSSWMSVKYVTSKPILSHLLLGFYTVKKLPWKPQNDDLYFKISGKDGEDSYISRDIWTGCMADFESFAVGNCFKSKEEAEEHKKEVVTRLKEIYQRRNKHEL